MERAQPLDISFTFSSTVGELGSIIHTLKKYSQILLALVEATGKKKKKPLLQLIGMQSGSTPMALASLTQCSAELRH